jgi:uncharacterized protein HemX
MSANAAVRTAVRPAERAVPRTPARAVEPRLRVVHGRAATGSPVAVAVLCLLLLVAGLVSLLMVNISLGHGSYELNRLQREADRLGEQQQALSDNLAKRAAPQELERAARRYGMVPADEVSFISLRTGKVSGAASTKGAGR